MAGVSPLKDTLQHVQGERGRAIRWIIREYLMPCQVAG
jgi:hypothetical protein